MGACSCGHGLAESDRYCPRCGTPAASQLTDGPSFVSTDGKPDADGALLLSGTAEPSSAASSSEVRSGPRGPWLVGGGIAVIALLWALFAWPQADAPIEGTGQQLEEAQEQSDEDGEATTTTRPPRTTASVETDDQAIGLADETEPDPDIRMVEGHESGPLLDEATDLALVLGGYGSSAAMELVDLDSGQIYDLEVRGSPVGSLGSNLIVDTTNGVVLITDLADLAAEPVRIGDNVGGWTSFVAVEDDLIWVAQNGGPDIPELQGYSPDGELQQTLDPGALSFFWGWNGDTDLFYNSAGGVYERAGESYRRVAPGLLRASGEKVALVHQCDEQMACRSVWLDRTSWEPLPYPAPDYETQTVQAQVAGDDRWLMESDWNSGLTTITDIETGETVRESSGFQNGPPVLPRLSDDGRWLFESEGTTETIIDLFNDREWEIELTTKLDLAGIFITIDGTEFDS